MIVKTMNEKRGSGDRKQPITLKERHDREEWREGRLLVNNNYFNNFETKNIFSFKVYSLNLMLMLI